MNPRTRWLLTALAGLALVGFLVSGGHQRTDEAEPKDEPESGTVSFPMPKPEPVKSLREQARGYYVLKTADRTITLHLKEGSRFSLTVSRSGRPNRVATGTWSLVGERLTMAYMSVPGRPEVTKDNPDVVTNTWRGKTIEMKGDETTPPVILKWATKVVLR